MYTGPREFRCPDGRGGPATSLIPRDALAKAPVEAAVSLHELFDRASECRGSALEPEKSENRPEECPERVDDQIPHRVDQSALLHGQTEDLIHRELKDFPKRADGQRKTEGDKCQRPGRCCVSVALKQIEDKEKADDPEPHRREGMQHHVPPPEALVEIEGLAQKQRGEDEGGKRADKGVRKFYLEAFRENERQGRQQKGGQADEQDGPASGQKRNRPGGKQNDPDDAGDSWDLSDVHGYSVRDDRQNEKGQADAAQAGDVEYPEMHRSRPTS